MDLRSEILQEHSRLQTLKIADWISSDKKRVAQLMDIFMNDESKVVQRAAWLIRMVYDKHPGIILPYMEQHINRMIEPGVHVAVKRNVVGILQDAAIPEPLQGQVMNACFDMLADPKETIAVRCHSMTVLDNLSKTYPEIRHEIVAIIRNQLEQETTAGFRARAKKILKPVKK